MRDYILLYINGVRHEVKGEHAGLNLANYLRYERGLTGTKIVCAEGDCGACTVLVKRHIDKHTSQFVPINSCIAPLYLLDCCHVISVEGIKQSEELHPVQDSMAKNHGAQCGYCTPGFINAMTALADDCIAKGEMVSKKKAKNYLTGNLCRCTGYKSILKAAEETDLSKTVPMQKRYDSEEINHAFNTHINVPVSISTSELQVHLPTTIKELHDVRSQDDFLSSGGTDLGVLINKGRIAPKNVLSLKNISDLYEVKETEDELIIGSNVNLDQVEEVMHKIECFKDFAHSLHIFASPQIKHKGTLVGNIANGSPIGDSLPFLVTSGARLVLESKNGSREIELEKFYKGYKDFDLNADEIITKVIIPKSNNKFKMYKVSNRKDLDISTVSMSVRYHFDGDSVKDFGLALGGVGPTVKRLKNIEDHLIGKNISDHLVNETAELLQKSIAPISDHRASKEYRLEVSKNLLLKFFHEVRA